MRRAAGPQRAEVVIAMTPRVWRLLVTEPADGATNMAIDEALWRGRRTGTSPPTLRFFAWAPPTVSLGYGQPLDDHVDVDACRALGVGLVRRPTGGSAIYHDGPERELTYSVIATAGDLGVAADLLLTYEWIGRALQRGLRALGADAELMAARAPEGLSPAFCFARTGTYEIEIGGRKVVGSAQRRQGASFLQHGSVLLGVDEPRLRVLFPRTRNPLSTLTTLEAALRWRPSFEEVARALAEAFEREHGLVVKPDGLSSDELQLTEKLVCEKYGTEEWLSHAHLSQPTRTYSGSPRPAAGLRLRTPDSGSPRPAAGLRLRTPDSGSPRPAAGLRLRTPLPASRTPIE